MPRPTTPKKKCSVQNCFCIAKAKGFCPRHYQRNRIYGDPVANIRDQEKRRGQSSLPEYWIWSSMVRRCTNPKNQSYQNYGGRGITVCDQWRYSFETFMRDMGPRPQNLTLERKNNEDGYSPENCTWASRAEQAKNKRTRSNTIVVTYEGITDTLRNFCRIKNIGFLTAYARLQAGWDIKRVLEETPKSKLPKQINYNGQKMTIRELSDSLGINYYTLWSRLKRGWSLERAVCP